MSTIQIPGYEIIEPIGEGAMGRVYKARQLSLGRIVAIKVLTAEAARDPSAVAQFRLEANAVANLKHPNILMVHEAGEVDGQHYFVMEYIGAYSVGAWQRRKGRLAEADSLTLADSVAHALQYSWTKAGLVHCDLKPDNLLIDEDGVLKVADFSGLRRGDTSPDAQLLASVVVGTPNYMSPEQVETRTDLDCRADIYSLGAVLYHCLTGVLPFGDAPDDEVLQRHLAGHLTAPRAIDPTISENASLLIEKMMVKDRAARYADWDDVLTDIARVRSGHRPSDPFPAPGASTVRRMVDLSADASPAAPPPSPAPPPAAPRPRSDGRRGPPGLRAAIVAVTGLLLIFLALFLYDAHRDALARGAPRPRPPAPTATPSPTAEPERAPPPPEPAATAEPAPPLATAEPGPAAVARPVEPAATPAAPPPESTEADRQRLARETDEYLRFMGRQHALAREGQFADSARQIAEWLAAAPDGEWIAAVRRHADRLGAVLELRRLCEERSDTLRGAEIRFTPGIAGEVVSVRNGQAEVVQRVGVGSVGRMIDLLRLAPPDLAALLRRATPTDAPLRLAPWLLMKGQDADFERALAEAREAGLDASVVEAWAADWRAVAVEYDARLAIVRLHDLVVNSRFSDAAAALGAARERYARTFVFTRSHADDLDSLARVIADEAGSAPAPAPTATPAPSPPRATPAPTPEPAVVTTSKTGYVMKGGVIDEVDMADLLQKWEALDGHTIKLRLRSCYASDVQPLEGGRVSAQINEGGNTVRVELSEEGRRWIESPDRLRQRTAAVFGVVRAADESLDLLGRSVKVLIGGQGYEFSW